MSVPFTLSGPKMKPDDKLRLVRNRGMIIRSLDVTTIMNFLIREQALTRRWVIIHTNLVHEEIKVT